ncbi:MAG: GWxTD domain-containing protein [Candidatus Latescibacteria bacterium]|nr:GWxTD domain-containing protein [Candidatus Latescibacterota bacterium]
MTTYRWFVGLILLLPVLAVTRTAGAEETASRDPKLLPAYSTGDIQFSVDAAGFKGAGGQTYEELYLLLRPNQLTLVEKGKKFQGTFQIDGVVYDESGAEKKRFSEQRMLETDEPVLKDRTGNERMMVDVVPVSLDSGTYRVDVVVSDLNSQKKGTCIKQFMASGYDDATLTISDIQFSTLAQPDTTAHRFTKNGILVVPNPARLFEKKPDAPLYEVADSPVRPPEPRLMYFYFEIYNFAVDPSGAPSTYDLSFAVIHEAGGGRQTLPAQKNIQKPGSSSVKVLKLDISSFQEGVYTLELMIHDNLSGQDATRRAFFEVFQPPPSPAPQNVLTKAQAERGYKMLRFIASSRDLALYKKLDLKGQTEFLINFWKERDPTPDTPENEFLAVLNERFTYAERTLGGADSDRGRVWMKYGEPEEIERHPSDARTKPYEIWFYTTGVRGDASQSTQGRQLFIFGDRTGYGKYMLLHSSVVGETHNPNWISELVE